MPLTAENFVLTGSRDPAMLAALDEALKYLERSPTAQRYLAMAATERAIEVNINTAGSTNQSAGTIKWDPSKGLSIVKPDMSAAGVQSPALGFMHELIHALDPNTYNPDSPEYHNDQWDNDAEEYAGLIEMQVAKELGEPVRENHLGIKDVPMNNTTMHTRQNPDGTYTWVKNGADNKDVEGPAHTPSREPGPAPDFPAKPAQGGGGGGEIEDGGNGDGGWDGAFPGGDPLNDPEGPGDYVGPDPGSGGNGGGAPGGIDIGPGGGNGERSGGNDDDEGELVPCIRTGEEGGDGAVLVLAAPRQSDVALMMLSLAAMVPAQEGPALPDAEASVHIQLVGQAAPLQFDIL